jgi:hypothetical protein
VEDGTTFELSNFEVYSYTHDKTFHHKDTKARRRFPKGFWFKLCGLFCKSQAFASLFLCLCALVVKACEVLSCAQVYSEKE